MATPPDLRDVFASAHEHAERTAAAASGGSSNGGAATASTTTVTSVLLRHGIMPDYRAVESSRDRGEAYASRLARERTGGDAGGAGREVPDGLALPQSPGAPDDDEKGERVAALHAMFSGFCHPSPSYGGVAGAYELERARVRSLAEGKEGGSGGLDAAGYPADGSGSAGLNSGTPSHLHALPREAVVRTTPRSARSIVRILRADPAGLLFLLPLEFQLAFFRVLIRTVADESDREYDAECLFDFSDGGDDGDGIPYDDRDDDGLDSGADGRDGRRTTGEGGDGGDSDDDSYDMIRNSPNYERSGSTSSFDASRMSPVPGNRARTASSDRGRARTASSGSADGNPKTAAPSPAAAASAAANALVRRATTGSGRASTPAAAGSPGGGGVGGGGIFRRNASAAGGSRQARHDFKRAGSGDGSGKAFEVWRYGRWERKRNAPLYSTMRFCTNDAWLDDDDGSGTKGATPPQSGAVDEVDSKSRRGFEVRPSPNGSDGGGGRNDRRTKRSNILAVLMGLYEAILRRCEDDCHPPGQHLLLGPVAHLIGLVCATGVTVRELRLLLVMIEGGLPSPPSSLGVGARAGGGLGALARLHIVRGLRYAAEYSVRGNAKLDRPGPRTFFTFGTDGPGISATYSMHWPFKYDFGMACWFRAETFASLKSTRGGKDDVGGRADGRTHNVVLFCARTQGGARIEVSFDTRTIGSSTAATLIVTVIDAGETDADGAAASSVRKSLRKVRLAGCVLSSKVWYHVAVRMSRPRISRFSLAPFAAKDEVSIFLNGKLMLKEAMRMPQFPDPKGASKSVFGSLVNKPDPEKMLVKISFLPHFDGQAGALYVFKDQVSSETISALYTATAESSGQNNLSHFGAFVDQWGISHGRLAHVAKVVNGANMYHSNLRDVKLPQYSIFSGQPSPEDQQAQRTDIVFDLVEENDLEADSIPQGLTFGAFGSNLFIVWDPSRISNGRLLDPHSRAHVKTEEQVRSWSFESVKDTIQSLGGVSRLLPLFEMLRLASGAANGHADETPQGVLRRHRHLVAPNLLFLMASFIRDHEVNSVEMFRCGAVNVIESIFQSGKKMDLEQGVAAMGLSTAVAKFTVSALIDLWQASRPIFALETTVFSRLVFNLPLGIGGASRLRGVSHFAILLPVLSEIAMMNPDKVRDCVDTADLLEIITEYSARTDEDDSGLSQQRLFGRGHSLAPRTLTAAERLFVVDTVFGIILIMLSRRCTVNHLHPLVVFITFNLDKQWESTSSTIETAVAETRSRNSTHRSTLKAVSILFFLLQKSQVHNLIESLADIFDNANGVASWILCCLVNSFNDEVRGLGIKCLASYLRHVKTATTASKIVDSSKQAMMTAADSNAGSNPTAMSKVKYGIGVMSQSATTMLSSVLSGKININVTYKLLWHLLKCHRERLGDSSNSALMYLIVEDGSRAPSASTVPLTDIILPNNHALGGFRISIDGFAGHVSLGSVSSVSRHCIQNKNGISTVLRLLRFLKNDRTERWLFDLLAFVLASPESVNVILSCDDWQPALFQMVADVINEIYGEGKTSAVNPSPEVDQSKSMSTGRQSPAVDTYTLSKPSVRERYDLSLKLYSTLLGHCARKGDEAAFEAIEMAASLQRVDANGSEVFCIILSHVFADLIERGTVPNIEQYEHGDEQRQGPSSGMRNRALKQSARLVTQAILSNGALGMDLTAAVKQWRCIRHLASLTVAVVTESGFGVVQLFDYRNQDAAAVDGITGGMFGIRLDNLVSGVNAFEALASFTSSSGGEKLKKRDRYRYPCVVLVSQVLTLIDAFIFPDHLDTAQSDSQLHGLTLVRSTEPRLGQSQGTLLASLIRLSLVLLSYLEPSSVKFLQASSRLRCFLHWALEIVRESVALGGYSQAFNELTAPLDRMVLAVVLHCHRALSRCSTVLVEMESSPWQKYFPDVEAREKSQRRLFRSILELREIVHAAYKGRDDVLRAGLSIEAHEVLARCLDELAASDDTLSSKEKSLRTFLANDWVTGFLDVQIDSQVILPLQVSNGQEYNKRISSAGGKKAMKELDSETKAIVAEYARLLDAPFILYCDNQRKWAETDAVRDREYEGDSSVKRLSTKYRADNAEKNKALAIRNSLSLRRTVTIAHLINNPWLKDRHWAFSAYTDLLYRRLLLHPNYHFDDHASASYELTLGKERETYQREEEERLERELSKSAIRAAIVPYNETLEADEDLDEEDESDNEGFLGWDAKAADDSLLSDGEDGIEVDGLSTTQRANGSEAKVDNDVGNSESADREFTDDSWDRIEQSEFDADENGLDPFAWARKFIWSEGERIVQSFDPVIIVSIRNTVEGVLLLTSQCLYFHQTGDKIDVMTKEKIEEGSEEKIDKVWKLNRLTDVHGRRYMLKAQALELFFADMEGLFITFDGIKARDLFHAKLRGNCKAPLLRSIKSLSPRSLFKKSKLSELWKKRKISNFQYIMALNLMAGRTFSDITQYPVFPWILADYTSETLDLSDHRVYRDLTKPVGALNPDRLSQLIERYNDLDGFPEEEKFLFGSHYSSPGVVLHYLIRQEPFTSMHISLQSGRFDCADRLFFDMGGCWKSCNTSTSDVKELIPEFFTCPEIFTNTNNFPLGVTQTKMPIDNVKLPPWAKGSPHEFIRLHRLALESDYVSNNLHHWIDLIFGFKQRGSAALSAHNLFHYLSYEGAVDIDKITDDIERKAIEGHIQNFGQTPSQLIPKEPHPSINPKDFDGTLLEDLCYENLHCNLPKKQFGGPKGSTTSSIASLNTVGDTLFAIHSDLSLCSYKLHPSRGSMPYQFKQDKCRRLESRHMSLSYFIGADSKPGSQSTKASAFREDSFAMAFGGTTAATTGNGSNVDDSHLLLSCGYFDGCVKVHSVDTLQLYHNLKGGHRGGINCIKLSSDGEILVTGGEDATCRLWTIDHDALASAITDGFVESLNREAEDDEISCCHVLLGHVTPICCVAICTKLDVVVSGSEDGSICVHNIRSGEFIRSLHIDAATGEVRESCARDAISVKLLEIHFNGSFVAHLVDGSLHVISLNGESLCNKDLGEGLNAMVICPDSEILVTGGELGCARIYSLHDLRLQCTVDVESHGDITSLAVASTESQLLCIGSDDGMLSIVHASREDSKG